jgi:hypothetical protein
VTEPPLTAYEIEIYDSVIARIQAGDIEAVKVGRTCLQLVMRNAPASIVLVLLMAIRDEAVRQSATTQN